MKRGLDPDNQSHRSLSNRLDEAFTGNKAYDNYARPYVHGKYHEHRFKESGNVEEWARAMDQYSKIGDGQQKTNFLNRYRQNQQRND